jgi:putative endonuclease
MYTVYALYSKTHQKIYIGYTSDLKGRLESHNIYSKKGWTVKFRPWELIYAEEFVTKSDAMYREIHTVFIKATKFCFPN